MATIRSYTSLEQSRKLAEILPLESADMHYSTWTILADGEFILSPNYDETIKELQEEFGNQIIPAWSLAALLGVLPKGTNISTPNPINELGYCCWNQYDEIYASNPIDACYEMIIHLHELKML